VWWSKGRRAGKALVFGRFWPWNEGTSAILTAMSHLEPILAPVIEAAGFRLVRLRLMGGKTKTLQIMA